MRLPELQRYAIDSEKSHLELRERIDLEIRIKEVLKAIDSAPEVSRGELLTDLGSYGRAGNRAYFFPRGELATVAKPILYQEPLAYIRQFLDSRYNEETRLGAAYSLGSFGSAESLPILISSSCQKEPEKIRTKAMSALAYIGGLDSTRRLLELCKEDNPTMSPTSSDNATISDYAVYELIELATGGYNGYLLGGFAISLEGIPSDLTKQLSSLLRMEGVTYR